MAVKTLDDVVESCTPALRELFHAVRALVRETAPELDEAIKWGQPVYERDRMVVYIKPAKAHVNLGFAQGADLDDPDGLLEGSGKAMRHVKLKRVDAMPREALQALIRQAVALNEN